MSANPELRPSGIPVLGGMGWGTHFCQFYQTRGQLVEVLVPYFEQGLRNHELCVWVTSEDLTTEEAWSALAAVVPDLAERKAAGQFEIFAFDTWYTAGGFDMDRILAGWKAKYDVALERGFAGLRVSGNTAWLESDDWESFSRYEASIDGAIEGSRILVLCTYSLDRCGAYELLDVVRNHQFALVLGPRGWERIETAQLRRLRELQTTTESRYHELFESMAEGFAVHEILCDPAGVPVDYRFIDVNPAFEKQTGLRKADVEGRTFRQVLPEEDPKWVRIYGKVALGGEPVRFESAADSLGKHYEVFAFSPGQGRFATLFLDVTERVQVEAALRESRDSLERKVEERTSELVLLNRTLRMISECNQILVRATDERRLMGDICDVVHQMGGFPIVWVGLATDDQAQSVVPAASTGLEDGMFQRHGLSWEDMAGSPTGICIRTAKTEVANDLYAVSDRGAWWTDAVEKGCRSCIALPLRGAGRVLGALTIHALEPETFDDAQIALLTELADDLAFGIVALRVQIERDHARSVAEDRANQLRALTTELVQTEQRERQRLAAVLHDHLQQLLVAAKFRLSSLELRSESEARRLAAHEVSDVVDEAIQAARSLTAELCPRPYQENGLAGGFDWLVKQMYQKHGLRVDVHMHDGVEPVGEPMRMMLFEAVRELLFNVVKHARTEQASVEARPIDHDRIRVVVTDKGAGFDPTRIADSSAANGGYGLTSIRERIGHLGGSIEMVAAVGLGSRFTLVVPRAIERAATGVFPGSTAFAAPSTSTSGVGQGTANGLIRVLLADDHPVVRQGLSRLFGEQEDIQVVGEANDGVEALELALELQPDVVIMDVTMPRLSGIEATQRILAEYPQTRVIGLSMHEADDMASAMRSAGAVAYLAKGGPVQVLVDTVRFAMHAGGWPEGRAAPDPLPH
jgi:PAS domain S-box-containing protein